MRLCRLPCGKPKAFRQAPAPSAARPPEAKPLLYGGERKPEAFRTGRAKPQIKLFGDESYSRVSKKTLAREKKTLAREKYIERKTKSLLVSLFY